MGACVFSNVFEGVLNRSYTVSTQEIFLKIYVSAFLNFVCFSHTNYLSVLKYIGFNP